MTTRNKTPNTSLMTVTPEMAKHWLETANTHNRPIRDTTVQTYARDMAAGHWRQTGEAIKFSTKGVLEDGGQRLAAIVRSNVSLELFVVWDLLPEAQDFMDTGRKRTPANMLHLAGYSDASTLAAAAKLAIGVLSGNPKPGSYEATHAEIAGFVKAHPDLQRAVEVTRPFARRTDCGPSVVAYTYYELAKLDKFEAHDFWYHVAESIAKYPGDPALALKRFFTDARRNRKTLTFNQRLSAIYRTWNARVAHLELRGIRTQANGKDIAIPKLRAPKKES